MSVATLPVRSIATRSALLQEIVQRIEEAALDELLDCGLDGETIDRLRAMPNGNAQHLIDASVGLFFVAINADRMRLLLNTLDDQQRAAALLEYYVEHGATLAMIRALLRPEKKVLASYLERLHGTRQRGRPTLPDTLTRDRIHAAWARATRATPFRPERERLLEMHRSFPAYTLATLYSVLNEFKR